MMCDIDHFKRVNGVHGHGTGDDVLREVARRLQQSVRSYDMVGMHGGEEFLAVLNRREPESAAARAENLREVIGRKPIAARGKSVPVTISIGLALSTDLAGGDVDEMIQEADGALYAAKSCADCAAQRV
jgi:diguanylate cyclase (GGDEF)-like protein